MESSLGYRHGTFVTPLGFNESSFVLFSFTTPWTGVFASPQSIVEINFIYGISFFVFYVVNL